MNEDFYFRQPGPINICYSVGAAGCDSARCTDEVCRNSEKGGRPEMV